MRGRDIDRRTLLRLSSVVAIASIAGCSGQPDSDDTPTSGQTDTATGTPTATAEPTESGAPPGADQLGGPNDLQSSASVKATVLSSDEGAGQYVNTPAVVWVEQGATVTWTVGEGSHSITAYHPDNDRTLGIPGDADPFDSMILESGETFEQTFEVPGVYDYWCRPHEGLGMVGLVVVTEAQSGPGSTAPDEIGQSAAADALNRLLDVAGIAPDETDQQTGYAWDDATWDSYWYSLYNMSTNIAMSANGVLFPPTRSNRRRSTTACPRCSSTRTWTNPQSRTRA